MKDKQLTAKELADLLLKMGSRRVYIAEDQSGNTFASISRATITFTRHSVLIYPDKTGLYPDDAEGAEYHIADMK